jgi:FixJ family two-component response regulator
MVLTDVVMPGMGGKALVSRIGELRPGVKTLFISGYTDNAISHHGILDSGVAFLQKPFTLDGLVRKVREVLDS